MRRTVAVNITMVPEFGTSGIDPYQLHKRAVGKCLGGVLGRRATDNDSTGD